MARPTVSACCVTLMFASPGIYITTFAKISLHRLNALSTASATFMPFLMTSACAWPQSCSALAWPQAGV